MAVEPYEPEVERDMKTLYESLNECDRRRYAAIEAHKLGHGGHSYIGECWAATTRRSGGLPIEGSVTIASRPDSQKRGDGHAVLLALARPR